MYLDYPGIRVTDLDRSLRFYTKGCGLREKRRGTMHHGGVWVLLEDLKSRQRLELNWYPPGSKYDAPYSVGEGLDHLGFRMPNVAAVVRKLSKLGAKVLDSFEEDRVLEVAFLTDPDGLWVELIRTPRVRR
jgi:catechol 2,3-dioxygenase-like lactoylglutathione lyase family enzyme